jgi:hypothetical protein
MHGLVLQLVISLAGVALMIGACALLFGTRDTLIPSAATVAERLAGDVPGFRASSTAVSRDGRAALLENTVDGNVYLAVVRGDETVMRRLRRGTLKGVTRDGGKLSLELGEFTLGRARLDLGDETAASWEARLKAIAA